MFGLEREGLSSRPALLDPFPDDLGCLASLFDFESLPSSSRFLFRASSARFSPCLGCLSATLLSPSSGASCLPPCDALFDLLSPFALDDLVVGSRSAGVVSFALSLGSFALSLGSFALSLGSFALSLGSFDFFLLFFDASSFLMDGSSNVFGLGGGLPPAYS